MAPIVRYGGVFSIFIIGCTFTVVYGEFCLGKMDGHYTYPLDCHKFYACVNQLGYIMPCAAGLVWNQEKQFCDYGSCSVMFEIGSGSDTSEEKSKAGSDTSHSDESKSVNESNEVEPPKQVKTKVSPKSKGNCERKVCYFTSWAQHRHGGKQLPADLDANLCTHIIHAFAKVKGGKLTEHEWNDDVLLAGLVKLKLQNPRLKILVAVGGWNHASKGFSPMVARRSSRKRFIESTLNFLRKYKLDGFDLDWEYPTQRGGRPEDKSGFTALCKELKAAFKPEGFLLTAAVAASENVARSAYDIPVISKYLDFINLMAYDLHGPFDDNKANIYHHSSLYKEERSDMTDVDSAVSFWLSEGAPREKMVLGIPFYARTYTISADSRTFVGAGKGGPITRLAGILSFYEVCDLINENNDGQLDGLHSKPERGPYIEFGNQWIGYENTKSIRKKVSYSLSRGLGGIMVWDTSFDDFTGTHCRTGKYPLLNAVNQACIGTHAIF